LYAKDIKINLESNGNLSIYEVISLLCKDNNISLFIKDSYTKKVLSKNLESISMINMDIGQAFEILFDENNIIYKFQNNILKLSYLQTKTFSINYLNTNRKAISNVNISLKETNAQNSKTSILSSEEFDFWKSVKTELLSILNENSFDYDVKNVTINKKAGLITITATKQQLKLVQNYLQQIEELLHKQVSIDVRIFSVALNKNKNIGIDWANINKLQSFKLNSNFVNDGTSFISIDNSVSVDTILNFLEQNGKVTTISNPKISVINNQPAIISVGEQINYISEESSMTADTTKTSKKVESMFSGVILDITPSISNDDKIILKINPSISSVKKDFVSDGLVPPTLVKKELSSVIIASNKDKIILGGLISSELASGEDSVVGLSNIPLFGEIFKSQSEEKQQNELVMVIIPTIY
jgi:general secretion pathway protein D